MTIELDCGEEERSLKQWRERKELDRHRAVQQSKAEEA
jgi:hypothetical protein